MREHVNRHLAMSRHILKISEFFETQSLINATFFLKTRWNVVRRNVFVESLQIAGHRTYINNYKT